MNEEQNREMIREDYLGLVESFDTLLLSTADDKAAPDASYAAYVMYQGNFYVYVSELAAHTGNLLQTGRASVLFLENEANADHLFARRRLTLHCDAAAIDRNSLLFDWILDAFSDKFGKLITTLRDMADFHLIQLSPVEAAYVGGFGKAYKVNWWEPVNVQHIRDKGHRRISKSDRAGASETAA